MPATVSGSVINDLQESTVRRLLFLCLTQSRSSQAPFSIAGQSIAMRNSGIFNANLQGLQMKDSH
jgi:hypothetical protein